MKGLTIIETEDLNRIFQKVDHMEEMFTSIAKSLQENTKPWMNSKEVGDYLGKGSTWIDLNKHVIGCSKVGGEWRFKRKDVEAYLESTYHKKK